MTVRSPIRTRGRIRAPACTTEPAPPPQVNHGAEAVATNLLRFLGPGATIVGAPVGQPVLLGYAQRRLFAVLVLTVHDGRVFKIEATVDPSALRRERAAD